MLQKLGVTLALVFGICCCATTDLPPVDTVDHLQLQPDEARIWKRSQEEQQRLNHSTMIYDDPALSAYVNEVTQKLVPAGVRNKNLTFQVYIIKNPLLNAFAYPNGAVYVHTGILALMENEAQLAALLGHEMTHVTHRHATENFRSIKNKTAFMASIQVAMVPLGPYGDLANILGAVGTMAAVSGYSRQLEREADVEGLELMLAAGYDPREAPRVFELLKQEVEEQDEKEPFFFGSHPRLQERIDNYRDLIRTQYPDRTGIKHTERFRAIVAPVMLENARLDLAMGRFRSAERTLEHYLEKAPADAKAHYCLGEVYRQRGQEGDREKAEAAFQSAIDCDPYYPDPHRQLGLIYYKEGRSDEAMARFARYLNLFPDAPDRGYILQYIEQNKYK